MAQQDCLWKDSAAWRWCFSLTVVLTALCMLGAPWRMPQPPAHPGQYTPPPVAQTASVGVPGSPGGAAASTASNNDPGFDRPVADAIGVYDNDTELHMIGVYGPAKPKGSLPWHMFCQPFSQDMAGMMQCQHKYAADHPEQREINVKVDRTKAPMVLVLMAYETTIWKLNLRPGVNLRKVILAGYSGQDIRGVPGNVPVEAYTHEASPCSDCSRQPGGFYAYDDKSAEYASALARIHGLTGLSPTTFQGGYQGSEFTITQWMGNARATAANLPLDPYTNKSFVNVIQLKGQTLLLPDGRWEGVASSTSPSAQGDDQLVALARSDKEGLAELLVIHALVGTRQSGGPGYPACNRPADYVTEAARNQPPGSQACYWANYQSDPWQQPIYRLAADRLRAKGIRVPRSALALGFHRGGPDRSVTTQYYAFAPESVESSGSGDWSSRPWSPSQSNNPLNPAQRYITERLNWAKGWFMLFSATR